MKRKRIETYRDGSISTIPKILFDKLVASLAINENFSYWASLRMNEGGLSGMHHLDYSKVPTSRYHSS